MAADKTLVQGAYNVALQDAATSVAGMQGKLDVISSITEGVTGFIEGVEAEGKKYDDLAQKVIDEAGMLGQEEASMLYDRLQEGRRSYIWGNKKDKAFSVRELGLQAGDYKDYESNRIRLAELKKDKTNGLSKAFLDDPENKAYLDILDDSSRLIPKTCPEGELNCPNKGRLGVEINGEWMSQSAITAKIEEGVVDTKTRELIGLWGQSIFTKSSQSQPGQFNQFNVAGETEKAKQILAGASNIKSIAKDPMFGTTSFEEDLFSKLTKETYADLLGPRAEEYVKKTSVVVDDGIDKDEAALLIKALYNDENALMDELTTYLVKFGGKQHEAGDGDRKKLMEGYMMTPGGNVVKDPNHPMWHGIYDEFLTSQEDEEGEETDTTSTPTPTPLKILPGHTPAVDFLTGENKRLTGDPYDYSKPASKLGGILYARFDTKGQVPNSFLDKHPEVKEILEDKNLTDDEKYTKLIGEIKD